MNLIYFSITGLGFESKGLAINTDEYVPASIPIRRTKVKDLIVIPPNMSKDTITTNVVIDVFMVRLIVCMIDKLIMSFVVLDYMKYLMIFVQH